jgi:methylthioribose-1-phosphate isomerase
MGNRDVILNNKLRGKVRTLKWENNELKLIDQRKLPFKEAYVSCKSAESVASAIKNMIVRGAPAIGVSAAYGVVLAALKYRGKDKESFKIYMNENMKMLADTRPTAINLFWALERMKKVISECSNCDVFEIKEKLAEEAGEIEREDLEINLKISGNGKNVFKKTDRKIKVLTHCNAGALATSGYGTALGVIKSLNEEGMLASVIVDETRPFLQGARLTSWELHQEGIPFFIIADNMAGYFMAEKEIDAVIVGADRIALNGDTANKIGTLNLSILALFYNIPFYVAAPLSTVDVKTKTGRDIPIEYRNEREIRTISGINIIPEFMPVKNPAFDVTPADNITAIITEEGVIYPPFMDEFVRIFMNKNINIESGV